MYEYEFKSYALIGDFGQTVTVSVGADGGFNTAYGDYTFTYEQFMGLI